MITAEELTQLDQREFATLVGLVHTEDQRREQVRADQKDQERIEAMQRLRTMCQEAGITQRIVICRESDEFEIECSLSVDFQDCWLPNSQIRNFIRWVPYRKIPRRLLDHFDTVDEAIVAALGQEATLHQGEGTLLLYGRDSIRGAETFRYCFLSSNRIRENKQ